KRLDRWRKIARAAGQQSRRVRAPEILDPVTLREACNQSAASRFYLEETPGCPLLLRSILDLAERPRGATTAIAVGPEGGWTDRERAQFSTTGWTPVSLGPQILRAETAALASVAVLSQAW